MQPAIEKKIILAAALLAGAYAVSAGPAGATGTARIQQPDGSVKTYTHVRIAVLDESMAITSSDGKGTVVFGKAACTKIGELVKCLPYDATLFQSGQRVRILLQSGTVWLNPSSTTQTLSYSTTQLPPHGVVLAVRTKRGTYVTLTGVVDEINR